MAQSTSMLEVKDAMKQPQEVLNLNHGFYKELMDKYGDYVLFDLFQGASFMESQQSPMIPEVFSWLPAASLVSGRVLVSPECSDRGPCTLLPGGPRRPLSHPRPLP